MAEKRLEIYVGVPPIPGDVNSGDSIGQPVILAGNGAGFSLKEYDWQPQRARTASESSQAQGRDYEDPTETIDLVLASQTVEDLQEYIVDLQNAVDMAKRFKATDITTTPVYLMYQDPQEGLEQYALILSADMVVNKAGEGTSAEVTLTVTRDPYWYKFPLFSNPKLHALEDAGIAPTPANVDLFSGSDDWKSATLAGKHEYDSTDYNGTPLSKNYIDISASEVPGDVPARLMLAFEAGASGGALNFFIARSTKKLIANSHDGSTNYQTYNFNAGDAEINSGGSKTTTKPSVFSTLGRISNGSNSTSYKVQVVAANGTVYNDSSAAPSANIIWGRVGGGANSGRKYLDKHMLRGRYACFFIGGISTASVTGVTARLQYAETDTLDPVQTIGEVEVQSGSEQLLHYVGEITLPLSQAVSSVDGRGTYINPNSSSNCEFRLDFRNSSGASRTISIEEMFIIPLDEPSAYINYVPGRIISGISLTPKDNVIYDTTGYMNRDNVISFAQAFDTDDTDASPMRVTGQSIDLIPNKDQRIYIFSGLAISLSFGNFYFNIMPRWIGIRDQ